MARRFPYHTLPDADLIVDAIYEGSSGGHLSGDALSHLLPGVGNQGGFRASGRGIDKKFIVLFTSGEDKDWPDHLDPNTGRFQYWGDNKTPGHELHTTQRMGNRILRWAFDLLHENPAQRSKIPPFLVFSKHATQTSARSVQYRGLAVPGFPGLPSTEDLVAVWKTSEGQRFQNYRAVFTILDVPIVSRAWLEALRRSGAASPHAPDAWRQWVETGRYRPLAAPNTTGVRRQESQLPATATETAILELVWQQFKDSPRAFEAFAARLFRMHDQRVIIDEITPSSGDGGRDAIGRYLLGLSDDPVYVEFSLEAKCYRPPVNGHRGTSVGVRDVARLISRIRHRQFGVLVTTSVVGRRAYEEVRQDRHPIVFVCGKDIVDILTNAGLNTVELVKEKLESEFALESAHD
ncbi:MAG: restriction endonuclease [Chloroflexi bacterium]|nr:restriction endonuclease [Chloroflexota bacterium]MCY3939235.1 restriction endonuclease [Chloroflexota bacterium]